MVGSSGFLTYSSCCSICLFTIVGFGFHVPRSNAVVPLVPSSGSEPNPPSLASVPHPAPSASVPNPAPSASISDPTPSVSLFKIFLRTSGRDDTYYTLNYHETVLQRVFLDFCNRFAIEPASTTFLFNSQELTGSETCDRLGMQEGAVIEVVVRNPRPTATAAAKKEYVVADGNFKTHDIAERGKTGRKSEAQIRQQTKHEKEINKRRAAKSQNTAAPATTEEGTQQIAFQPEESRDTSSNIVPLQNDPSLWSGSSEWNQGIGDGTGAAGTSEEPNANEEDDVDSLIEQMKGD